MGRRCRVDWGREFMPTASGKHEWRDQWHSTWHMPKKIPWYTFKYWGVILPPGFLGLNPILSSYSQFIPMIPSSIETLTNLEPALHVKALSNPFRSINLGCIAEKRSSWDKWVLCHVHTPVSEVKNHRYWQSKALLISDTASSLFRMPTGSEWQWLSH